MKKFRIFLLSALTISMVFTACKKDEEDDNSSSTTQQTAWVATPGGTFDYVGVAASQEMVAIKTNEQGTMPVSIFYQKSDGPAMMMFMDDMGYPKQLVANGTVMLFSNAEQSKLDVGVVSSQGEIEIFRDVAFDNSVYFNNPTYAADWGSVLKWSGNAMKSSLCLSSQMAATQGAMLTAPFGAYACQSQIKDIAIQGTTALGTETGFASAAQKFNAYSVSSANDLLMLSSNKLSQVETQLYNLQDKINLAASSLNYGYGDVQVTLTWDNESDLDLWVTDPTGELIYYGNDIGASGGQLDVDDTDGYGPENIFWGQGLAPTGQYKVQLDYYSGVGVANYSILVSTSLGVQQYSGSISPDQTLDIVTFVLGKSLSVITDQPRQVQIYNKPAKN